MASFVSRTNQKIKEWWGAKITQDPALEAKKQKINEIDSYFKALSTSYQSLAILFQQINGHFGTIASATAKLYEKETDTNKRIGIEIASMFGNLSELYRSKVEATNEINKNFNEWFSIIETLKVQMKYFHEVRLVYDHYKGKVNELQTDAAQNLSKGVSENFKLTEKLRRNQSKLSNSENTYNSKLSEIINNMNKLLYSYYKMINNSFDQLIIVNYDLNMNAKSILKKNLKAFNKFKYPEMEPIIDLVKAKDFINQAQQQVEKKVDQIKAAKWEASKSDQNSENSQNNNNNNNNNNNKEAKLNPFSEAFQQQTNTNQIPDFFDDDSNMQMQMDMRKNQSQINPQFQSQQYQQRNTQSAFMPQQQFNPFQQQQINRQSMQQQSPSQFQPMSPFDEPIFMSQNPMPQQRYNQQNMPYGNQIQQQQQQQQQQFPEFDFNPQFNSQRATYDNPYTYSQQIGEIDQYGQQQRQSNTNRNTNPFM